MLEGEMILSPLHSPKYPVSQIIVISPAAAAEGALTCSYSLLHTVPSERRIVVELGMYVPVVRFDIDLAQSQKVLPPEYQYFRSVHIRQTSLSA